MLFAYLTMAVAQLSGPVVSYWNFSMTDHVQAEYFRSSSGACTIGVSFRRRGDESEITYSAVDVTSSTGSAIPIVTMEGNENVVEPRIARGYSARVVLEGVSESDVHPDTLTSYIIHAGNENFTYSTDVYAVRFDGKVITETSTVFCDASKCNCSTRGPKYASRSL